MIQIPVHNAEGKQIDTLELDEQLLGGEVRPVLLKQAYVRFHANQRQGSAHTRSRGHVSGSTRKLYRQKGTGNARRGDRKANVLRGGGHAKAKLPHSWRKDMPHKMRKLANRNSILAKAVDGEVKIIDKLAFDKPSTRQFATILKSLQIDRTCLVALRDTRDATAVSARNVANVRLTLVDQLNAFDVLNNHFLLVEKQVLSDYLAGAKATSSKEAK